MNSGGSVLPSLTYVYHLGTGLESVVSISSAAGIVLGIVPAGWLVMGVPAKPIRKMSEEELEDIRKNAVEYLELWHRDYRS